MRQLRNVRDHTLSHTRPHLLLQIPGRRVVKMRVIVRAAFSRRIASSSCCYRTQDRAMRVLATVSRSSPASPSTERPKLFCITKYRPIGP